jgi:hypothetical protein
MKKISLFSKNFKELLIGLTIVELIFDILIFTLKNTISLGEYSYGHTAMQAYIFYVLIFLCIVIFLFMPYLDYKNLIKHNITTPKLWKKLYVIFVPFIALVFAVLNCVSMGRFS